MVLTVCPVRCSTCSGRGSKTCATCKGEKKLLHFIQLVIMWYVAASQRRGLPGVPRDVGWTGFCRETPLGWGFHRAGTCWEKRV